MNGNFVEDFEIFVAENIGCDLDQVAYGMSGIETREDAEAWVEKLRAEYKTEKAIHDFCEQYDYEYDPQYVEECFKTVDNVIDGGPEYGDMPSLVDDIMEMISEEE